MYRPLNQNEYAIVSKTIYQERGLEGGLADSMFMAYKARAMALDEPEFVIFQETEVERKARIAEKQREKVTELKTGSELAPMDFLRKLEAITSNDRPRTDPENAFEWFYGDETVLDARYKRLRVKYFNSENYRKVVLQQYLDRGVLREIQLQDTELIRQIIGEFHRKYPGTRQGIISYYEILFGDPSEFSYDRANEREKFFNDPHFRVELLKKLRVDANISNHDLREHLKKSALDTGAATVEQIKNWERMK
jgi:hypothetical protein